VLSWGNAAAKAAAIWVTLGAEKDVPTASELIALPPLRVDRTSSGQTCCGVVKLGEVAESMT
jgi:hypothetical protein